MKNLQEKDSNISRSPVHQKIMPTDNNKPVSDKEQDADDLVHNPQAPVQQEDKVYDPDDLVHDAPVLPVTDEDEFAEAMHRDTKRNNP